MNECALPAGDSPTSEMLILPDGRIFVHNLTPAVAKLLAELNPADAPMHLRAGASFADALSHPTPHV